MTRQLCNECGLALNEDHAQRTEKLSKGQAIAHASPIKEKKSCLRKPVSKHCKTALYSTSPIGPVDFFYSNVTLCLKQDKNIPTRLFAMRLYSSATLFIPKRLFSKKCQRDFVITTRLVLFQRVLFIPTWLFYSNAICFIPTRIFDSSVNCFYSNAICFITTRIFIPTRNYLFLREIIYPNAKLFISNRNY